MSANQYICKNCEQSFEDDYSYCPHCGQKTKDELTLKVLFSNTISNYFSVDARFFKSFIPLMIRPGYLARRFLEGKRLLYLHPAQMYLFISVVFFFLFSFVARVQTDELNAELKKTLHASDAKEVLVDSITKRQEDSLKKAEIRKALQDNKFLTGMKDADIDSIMKEDNMTSKNINFGFNENELDSLIGTGASDKELYKAMGMEEDAGSFKRKFYAQTLKFYKSREGGSVLKVFYDTIPIAMFILLPIFALILKIFYYRKGPYAYHLVFSFYFFAFLFTVFSILLLCNFAWAGFPGWLISLVIFSTFFYLYIALKRFYNQGWFLSFIKSNLVSFVFLLLLIPITIFIVFFAFLNY